MDRSITDGTMKPRVRDHYHAHRLSYWLNLIPRLHRSGDVNVTAQHHRLPDHDNPQTYDGVIRKYKYNVLAPPLPELHPTPTPPVESSKSATLLIEFKNVSTAHEPKTEENFEASQGSNLTDSHPLSTHSGIYSTALSVTIAVGCSLLILNVLIFAGIYYQKDKDNLEKKLQKAFYQDRRSEDEEGHQSGEKPFLVKDLSSSMMLTQFGCPQEFDGGQSLDLVQPSKSLHQQSQMQQQSGNNSLTSSTNHLLMATRTPQGERGHEIQPLLATAQQTPPGGPSISGSHTVTATVDCIPPWPHQEVTVFGIDSKS